ncbi:MAG: acyl-CoA dehydrogenase family protein, partial [Pseudomonadota bacterium]
MTRWTLLRGQDAEQEGASGPVYDHVMSFGHGDEIDALRDSVRRFAQKEIAPLAAEIDRTDEAPYQLWPKMGGLG